MVFYRKYRPQTIDELDNAKVRKTLLAVLAKDIPHAFFFTGPKGLGKTSAARIVAKVVNCEKLAASNSQIASGKVKDKSKSQLVASSQEQGAKNIEPCNQCEQCVSITNGSNLDVLEFDAASNRGIDEIRDLKDKIRLAPIKAKMKVYIVDEVHMLTTEAFNALLKTLEEPPGHAMFILCTTEPHKVPQTIHSRCFHIAFELATEEELIRSFTRIIEKENLAIEKDALRVIAQMANGGFRDGTKILEETVAIARGAKITFKLLGEVFKTQNVENHLRKCISALEKKNAILAVDTIAKLIQEGVDLKYFLILLMETLHGMLLAKVGIRGKTGTEPDTLLSVDDIRVILELLGKSHEEMKFAVIPQLPLELVFLDWVTFSNDADTSSGDQKTTQQATAVKGNGVSVASLRKQVGNVAKIKALYGEDKTTKLKDDASGKSSIAPASVSLLHYSSDGEITKEWLDMLWAHIIAETKHHNHTLAGVLRGCRVSSFDRKHLTIETAYVFHKERLDDQKIIKVLEKICGELTGNPIQVSVVLKSS